MRLDADGATGFERVVEPSKVPTLNALIKSGDIELVLRKLE